MIIVRCASARTGLCSGFGCALNDARGCPGTAPLERWLARVVPRRFSPWFLTDECGPRGLSHGVSYSKYSKLSFLRRQ